MMTSRLPNWLPRPKRTSITKKRTAQRGDMGMLRMASENATKDNPGPWAENTCVYGDNTNAMNTAEYIHYTVYHIIIMSIYHIIIIWNLQSCTHISYEYTMRALTTRHCVTQCEVSWHTGNTVGVWSIQPPSQPATTTTESGTDTIDEQSS